MKIKRELILPASLAIVRQRLTSAFTSPIVLEEGNLILARVECCGSIQGDTVTATCVINGKSLITNTRTYTMQGYLSDHLGRTRLEMTIKFDFSNPIYFVPLIGVLFWSLIHVFTGRPVLPFGSFPFNGPVILFFIGFIYVGLKWHLSHAADQFEEMIKKCVFTNPINSPKP